mmetsp:Transcript_32361/g.53570  ORF Transcript_32361/g.53570 Transcript_32361/m.53570 type:complete len:316 (+) Transcript_32361:20-967(+)
MDAASKATLLAFLDRIGLYDESEALIAREPSAEDLGLLLRAFLLSVPFENLGQHSHPAGDGIAAVPAGKHIPSLQMHKTLKKVVYDHRGGLGFELNFGFAWLLRSLGYKVRLAASYVIKPDRPVAGHLALFVDGLGPQPLHVDPGFPKPGSMAAVLSSRVTDSIIGDAYHFAANDDPLAFGQTPEIAKRCGQVLMRSRKTGFGGSALVDPAGLTKMPPPAPEMTPPEPVYLVSFEDDLALDCDEFQAGIAGLLAPDETNRFSQKRICIMMRDGGFDRVGEDHVREIRHGKEVKREALKDEAAYRQALKQVAGIVL